MQGVSTSQSSCSCSVTLLYYSVSSHFLNKFSLTLGLDKETCLIPVPPQQQVEPSQSYSLLTENLILTQLSLHLGFHRFTNK